MGLSSNWTENRVKPGRGSHFFASFSAVNGANCGNAIAKGRKINSAHLGSVVNTIVLWNTIYMEAVLERFRKEEYPVNEVDKARLSPLIHEHINTQRRHSFVCQRRWSRGNCARCETDRSTGLKLLLPAAHVITAKHRCPARRARRVGSHFRGAGVNARTAMFVASPVVVSAFQQ